MDKHKIKLKLARKIITSEELKAKTPVFNSKAWLERKKKKEKEVIEREKEQKRR